jgi:hypothetical protein
MIPLQIINRLRFNKSKHIQTFLEKNKQRNVLIFSGQWDSFCRENQSGYTYNKSDAGIYTFEEAFNSTLHCGNEKQIFHQFLN